MKKDLGPDHWFALGLHYLREKDYEKAIRAIDRAVLLKPKWVEPYFTLSQIYAVQKNYESAIDATKRLLKADPDNADAHYNLGELYTASKQYTQAISAYERALSLKTAKKERILKILPQLKKLAGSEPDRITFSTHHHV